MGAGTTGHRGTRGQPAPSQDCQLRAGRSWGRKGCRAGDGAVLCSGKADGVGAAACAPLAAPAQPRAKVGSVKRVQGGGGVAEGQSTPRAPGAVSTAWGRQRAPVVRGRGLERRPLDQRVQEQLPEPGGPATSSVAIRLSPPPLGASRVCTHCLLRGAGSALTGRPARVPSRPTFTGSAGARLRAAGPRTAGAGAAATALPHCASAAERVPGLVGSQDEI